MITNADEGDRPRQGYSKQQPDPQGQAALLLVESLIHGLIAKSLLSTAESVEIIDIAADVKRDVAEENGEPRAIMAASLAMLNAMSSSLRRDIGQ